MWKQVGKAASCDWSMGVWVGSVCTTFSLYFYPSNCLLIFLSNMWLWAFVLHFQSPKEQEGYVLRWQLMGGNWEEYQLWLTSLWSLDSSGRRYEKEVKWQGDGGEVIVWRRGIKQGQRMLLWHWQQQFQCPGSELPQASHHIKGRWGGRHVSTAAFLAEQSLLCCGAPGSEQRIVTGLTQTSCMI